MLCRASLVFPLSFVWISAGAFAQQKAIGSPAADLLFQAIQKSDARALKLALDRGVNPNVKDAEGTPALMAAVLFARPDCVQLLLDRDADANITNPAGATALMWAIPDLAKVKLLLSRGANVNARSGNLQRTPLLIAASYPGTAELLKLLLDSGADLHTKDRSGAHALSRAVLFSDVAVVQFLVEHGCDPDEDYPGRTRMLARHNPQVIEYLLSIGAKVPPDALTIAVNWHDPKLIERWIGMGADVNATTGVYARSPLMTAAASEQAGAATLRMLLAKGASPNAQDTEGERPLDWAMYRADQAKVDVLREFGAKPGNGPRHEAYPAPEPGGIADAKTSLSRSLALLLPTGPVIYEKRKCISCHSQALPVEAAAVARRKGIVVKDEFAQRNLEQILESYQIQAEAALQGDQPPGNFVTVGYVMSALKEVGHPLDRITAGIVHMTAGQQMPDGRWLGNGLSRPPMEDSVVSQTALAARALALYPFEGAKGELAEHLRRAQQWLLAVKPSSTEERNMRLMGLVWTNVTGNKAAATAVHDAVRDVMAQQRPDGGWAQRPQERPDAYATGMSLYALHEAGVPVTAEAYRKGVAFLLADQYQNGAWLVKTRSYPVQPYFESGYPFGHNQWISAGGASWASLAIALTLPEQRRAAK